MQKLEVGHDPVLGEQESFPEKVKQIMGELPQEEDSTLLYKPSDVGTQADLHGGLDT